ncbi:RNA polymerase subunit sigma [Saccharobesus litoralis]|uniref:RNA polymerase subunit sigma n=1 Tax=Saccharobesus litoralis TaxID=2172099 RepID=A0A2S0VXL2_9ALTE|nr:RNA polymerase subunit sigma [Saccharobesus litoralis]
MSKQLGKDLDSATTSSDLETLEQSKINQFLDLFEADRKRIYAYIYAYVMDKAAADDIFQDTSMVLWREFEKFEIGTNFSKWANGIVFNRVRTFRRNNKHLSLGLSEERLEEIFACESIEDNTEQQWQLLQTCRSQLLEPDQKLYQAFYVENNRAAAIAEQTGRSIYAIRKSIHRLRKKLFDCVDRKLRGDLL